MIYNEYIYLEKNYTRRKSTEQSLEICPEANAGEIKHIHDKVTLSG
jgi:hypothetical protein